MCKKPSSLNTAQIHRRDPTVSSSLISSISIDLWHLPHTVLGGCTFLNFPSAGIHLHYIYKCVFGHVSSLQPDFLLRVNRIMCNVTFTQLIIWFTLTIRPLNTSQSLSCLLRVSRGRLFNANSHVTWDYNWSLFKAMQTTESCSKPSHQNTHMDETCKYTISALYTVDCRQCCQYRNCFSCLLICQVSPVVLALQCDDGTTFFLSLCCSLFFQNFMSALVGTT